MAVCNTIGIELQFMQGTPYYHNVGLKRVLNHYQLADFFRKTSRQKPEKPTVVIASTPPPMLTYQSVRFAKEYGAKMIVDTQDLWPEVFYHLVPSLLRPFSPLVFMPWHKMAGQVYKLADAYIGSAKAYIEHAIKLGGAKKITATIPLGLDYHLFDSSVSKGYRKEFTKPEGEVWFIYAGSLTRNHDFLTPIHAFTKIHKTLNIRTKLFIVGRGYLSNKVRQIIQEQKLTNVVQTGFLNLNELAYLLKQCDVGLNPSWPETMIYLPYKLFYYFAAGLAVLNTMPGECSQIINQNQCGLDYTAGDINSCIQAIEEIVSDLGRLHRMQQNSRHLAETVYDRKVLYQQYVDLIEKVVNI